jgi:hypothetical protein
LMEQSVKDPEGKVCVELATALSMELLLMP